MQIALVSTKLFWIGRCEPLLQLGVHTWRDALNHGLINEREFNLCSRQTGEIIPNLEQFLVLQQQQLANLKRIAT